MLSRLPHPEIPILNRFEQVADRAGYVPLPDEWVIGIADVVDSTGAIAAGRYKSVNFAGAAVISAATNAVGGQLPLFAFGGDGAHFVVRPDQADAASDALLRVSRWVGEQLDLKLRVGMVSIRQVRDAGFDVNAAYWQASPNVQYTLFSGGGLEWAEKELKAGNIAPAAKGVAGEPDLTGLSCQWGPVQSSQGQIISLIVKPAPDATPQRFEKATKQIIQVLEEAKAVNPVPEAGPAVDWPSQSLSLQARVSKLRSVRPLAYAKTFVMTVFYWGLFKLAIPVRGFLPDRYRAEIAANSDFQKFNDGLMMTMDCTPEAVTRLKAELDRAEADGTIRHGLHVQDEALITCVVPSAFDADHMHFIDGSGGGYAAAAKQMRIDA